MSTVGICNICAENVHGFCCEQVSGFPERYACNKFVGNHYPYSYGVIKKEEVVHKVDKAVIYYREKA